MYFILSLLAALILKLVSAELFAGCFDPKLLESLHLTPQSYDPNVITCPALCRQQFPGVIYAYSRRPSTGISDALCWCTTYAPQARYLLEDSSCPYPNLSAELVNPPPNWSSYKCFDFLSQGPVGNFTVTSLTHCLTSCSSYPNAYFSYLDNANHMSCACYQRGPPFTIDACGKGIYFHYYHTPGGGATPGQLAKKRNRASIVGYDAGI